MNRAETLDAARQAVLTDRSATHGDPESSFALIADLWSALLAQDITPAQVCLMLATLKVARGWDNPHHADNWTDIAGYAACGAEMADEGPAPCAVTRGEATDPRWAFAQTAAEAVGPAEIARRMDDMKVRLAPLAAAAAPAVIAQAIAHADWPLYTPNFGGPAPAAEPEGGEAAETAPEAVAVPTSAVQDSAGAPPSVSDPVPGHKLPAGPGYKPPRERNAKGFWSGGWTEDEDATAVALVAAGHSFAETARRLERDPSAAGVTLATRLAPRIAEAKAALAAVRAYDAACIAPAPEAVPLNPGAGEGVAPPAPEAAPTNPPPSRDADEASRALARILRSVAGGDPAPGTLADHLALVEAAHPLSGWTREADCELLRLALLRWPLSDVARELAKPDAACKARQQVLTCNKHWPMKDVAAALGVAL